MTGGGNVSLSGGRFIISTGGVPNDTYTLTMTSSFTRASWSDSDTQTFTFSVNIPPACVAEGTLITLADGTQRAVEELTGDEELLVWNMNTGAFDSAPILFIDSDPYGQYEVIRLTFSDGTEVEVIDEHAFWDVGLNRYVFLDGGAAQYIGRYFNKQILDSGGNMIWTAVRLTEVETETVSTTAWSPVTYGHLCYYVNGMLSMPGGTGGLINIFEVDGTLMRYDAKRFFYRWCCW